MMIILTVIMVSRRIAALILIPVVICFSLFATKPCSSLVPTRLDPDEVTLLKQIGKSFGKYDWNFSANPCSGDSGWITNPTVSAAGYTTFQNSVTCYCPENGTVCHVKTIALKAQGLPGNLPGELARLPFLDYLDLSANYLNGTIPKEWGSMPRLALLCLRINRLSGPIPKELGNITTLQNLYLEGNMFSGQVPLELGNLTSLVEIVLYSNYFTGELPTTFSKLINMTSFEISSNAFTGIIPDYITTWTGLARLEIQGTLMEGPVPQGIFSLEKLTSLIISDLSGTFLTLPSLKTLTNLQRLVIRNCMLSGEIPEDIGSSGLPQLQYLDLSFNNLTGVVPSSLSNSSNLERVFMTSNNLEGPMPDWILRRSKEKDTYWDFSYNNFTSIPSVLETSEICTLRNVNLVESFSENLENQSTISPCLRKHFPCENGKPQYTSVHINCGSRAAASIGTTSFEADTDPGTAASLFISNKGNWAFSNTGTFYRTKYTDYYATNSSVLNISYPELYKTARISPLSLKYYGLCLMNGAYTVNLHFAEIVITDDKNYTSLVRRIFDIYIQGKLVQKDFNIKEAAGGANRDVILTFTANVSAYTLEIHFFWAGKGVNAVSYGPLISAISIEADFESPGQSIEKRWMVIGIAVGITSFLFLTVLIFAILWKRGCFIGKPAKGIKGEHLQTYFFSLRHIKFATNNFDSSNKIGEGGFGPVYKGRLSDGTTIAVKQLSSKSRQGNREFINEIGLISASQHPNLVKLYGCCTEGNQLNLVYEYMENNSLARALFSREDDRLKLDWPVRHKICIGIARGLAYLHEESVLKIVHRDIKSTNVLLDKDLNAKISDFGLAKLDEDGQTHMSTRIAGTFGYMAPEYAAHGHLTYKADVYSFGVVALEIVTGKMANTKYEHGHDCFFLRDWACLLQDTGNLLDIVDPELGSDYLAEEVLTVLNVALLCSNFLPSIRPTMSTVVSMLEGNTLFQSPFQSPERPSAGIDDTTRFFRRQPSKMSEKDSMDAPWTESSKSATYDSKSSGLLGNSSNDLYPVYGTNTISIQ